MRTPRAAHRLPARGHRRVPGRALRSFSRRDETRLLPAGNVLQHRRRADVGGDDPSADGDRPAPGRAAQARRRPRGRRLPRPGDRGERCAATRCSGSRTGSRRRRSSWTSGPRSRPGPCFCFNYPEFHLRRVRGSRRIRPRPVGARRAKDANHIPFGVTANRPCPARGVAPVAMRAVVRETRCAGSRLLPPPRTPARSPTAARACSSRARIRGVTGCGSRRCGCATGGRTSGAAWSSSSAARRWCWRPGGCGSPAGTSRRPRPKAPCDEAARVLGWRAGGHRRCGAARPGLRHGPARPLHDGRDADEPSDAGQHGAHHRQAWPWPAGACCPVAGRAGPSPPTGSPPWTRRRWAGRTVCWRSCCSSAWSSTR